ncbi:nucleotidyl transferase AbiEii/AbiGii toxin family protein, partial [Lactococcus petauri]|uniref:nucleotidyl transferase AbiEii/AbiGii toxin family protein n=1 Tax=Lactococcus petauri TaxID=1940789 RepID=UPI00254A8E5B
MKSDYKDKFVIKGGFLQGVLYNLEQRATRNLDASTHDMEATHDSIEKAVLEICSINLNDNVSFDLRNLVSSQEGRIYSGFRAKLVMIFLEEQTKINFDLDVGVGDEITPRAQKLENPLFFNEEKGKKETILVRGLLNSRMKYFYDMHLFCNDPE